jgi:hypothetical protein
MPGRDNQRISQTDAQQRAEVRESEVQLERQRTEFVQEHEARRARRMERAQRETWWQRLMRLVRGRGAHEGSDGVV